MEREWEPIGSRRDAKVELAPAQYLVVAYVSAVFFGALLLTLPQAAPSGRALSFFDALFMATSALCVTGLSVVDPATELSLFGQLILLALIQVGAVGILTVSTFFLLLLGKRIRLQDRISLQQDLNHGLLSGLVRLVRQVIATTILVEAIGALLLYLFLRDALSGSAWYFAAFHSVAAFANAGFDLFGDSLRGLRGNWGALLTLVLLIEAGGIGFGVLQELRAFPKERRLSLHAKVALAATGALLASGTVLSLMLEGRNGQALGGLPLGSRAFEAFFLAATGRTAGFSTVTPAALREATLFVLMGLMFIGASPGSTGGGIKTTTAAAVLAAVRSSLRGQREVVLFRRRLPSDALARSLAVIATSTGAIALGFFAIALLEEAPALPILFEVVSAFSTAGLSTGLTAAFAPASKGVLILLMLAGRLGPMTLALALAGRARGPDRYRFPEERLPLG